MMTRSLITLAATTACLQTATAMEANAEVYDTEAWNTNSEDHLRPREGDDENASADKPTPFLELVKNLKREQILKIGAGVLGVTGLGLTVPLAKMYKKDWVDNGNTANTKHLGFTAEDAAALNADSVAHDLHDVMFAKDLSSLRETITLKDGTTIDAENAFDAGALSDNINSYLTAGMVFAVVAIVLLALSLHGSKFHGISHSGYISGAIAVGLIIGGGHMIMDGYSTWLTAYAENAAKEIPQENMADMAFGDQGAIIAGIVLAAVGMGLFLIFWSVMAIKNFCELRKAKVAEL